ncbi:hypothetical protein [Agrobacterium pusense]|uniref:hypothetical protein n=1 Tax=Agrobacterium pusense TaxID=648995 RepID=UPI001CB78DCF|nr:hypothetical protein [Agrobacterium pusense]
MFSGAAVTFIRAVPGEGATLRALLENDALNSGLAPCKPEILTCSFDPDFLCVEGKAETGVISLSQQTKCRIKSVMMLVGVDINRQAFH